jgi:cbb3-type cytochrome oxidase subunit 3
MKQAVLGHWDLPWLPLTALMLFVICFSAYVYWTYKKENKKVYDKASLIPLEEPAKVGSRIKG